MGPRCLGTFRLSGRRNLIQYPPEHFTLFLLKNDLYQRLLVMVPTVGDSTY